MLDVKLLRDDFEAVSEKLVIRGVKAEDLAEFKELDVQRRAKISETESLKQYRNTVSQEIALAETQ